MTEAGERNLESDAVLGSPLTFKVFQPLAGHPDDRISLIIMGL